eukprot:scaffold2909_cov28-Tisochrysis_lutea.AAC.4
MPNFRWASSAERSSATSLAAARCPTHNNVSNSCVPPVSPADCSADTTLINMERIPTKGCFPMPPLSGSPDSSSSRTTRRYMSSAWGCVDTPYFPNSAAAEAKSPREMSAAPWSVAYLTSMGPPDCCARSRARSHSPRCAYASSPSATLPPCTKSTALPAPFRCSLYRCSTSFALAVLVNTLVELGGLSVLADFYEPLGDGIDDLRNAGWDMIHC